MEEIQKTLKEIAISLIENIGFSSDPVIARRGEIYLVNLQVEEPSLLIGRDGENLEALQHLLRILVRNKNMEFTSLIVVDVNGYRDKKTAHLEKRAREIAHKVRTSGKEEELPPMNSFERRLVHTIITNIADVESESRGDRGSRRIVIKPKK